LFERIENVFRRLEVYIEVPPTIGMMDAIVKVIIEVLSILAIVTKEIKQSRASESTLSSGYWSLAHRLPETFVKKLVGRKDIRDALQRLEKVTVEEARMATAESLKSVHGIGDKVVNEVHVIHDAVKAFEDRFEGMIQDAGGRLLVFDDKVQVTGGMVKTGAQECFDSPYLLLIFLPLGVEKTGRRNTNESDTMATLKTTNDAENKMEVVNDGARNINNVQSPVTEIDVDGAQVIRNQSSLLPLSASYG
jgi:hypothetical protein